MKVSQLHKLHKELWDWLVENPKKEKWNWPRWRDNGGNIKHATAHCFACTFAKDNYPVTTDNICETCLLNWPGDSRSPCDDDCGISLFGRWEVSTNKYNERPQLAREIRDLPLSEYAKKIQKKEETNP